MVESKVVLKYINLLESQRQSVFTILDGITEDKLWKRSAPKEWSIGEILDHNYLLFASFLPIVQSVWRLLGWYGRLHRNRIYKTEYRDIYRDPSFPNWVGFLWAPRYNTRKPVPLETLKSETRDLHAKVHRFYENKDEDVLGNFYLYDPVFGWCNLIVTLRIGIYHDQLHYDDVIKQANQFKQ